MKIPIVNYQSVLVLILSFTWWVIFTLILVLIISLVNIRSVLTNVTLKEFYISWLMFSVYLFTFDCLFFVPMMRKRIIHLNSKLEPYVHPESKVSNFIHFSILGKYYMLRPF